MSTLEAIALILGVVFIVLGAIFLLNGTGLINGGVNALRTNATTNPGQGFISYLTGFGAGIISDVIGAILLAVGIVLAIIALRS